jgi:hypothetical protein
MGDNTLVRCLSHSCLLRTCAVRTPGLGRKVLGRKAVGFHNMTKKEMSELPHNMPLKESRELHNMTKKERILR